MNSTNLEDLDNNDRDQVSDHAAVFVKTMVCRGVLIPAGSENLVLLVLTKLSTNYYQAQDNQTPDLPNKTFLWLSLTPYRVLLSLLGHSERSVSEFIVLALLRLYSDGVWTRPILAVYHGPEHPQLVCPVMDDKVTRVAGTDVSRKMKNLENSKRVVFNKVL